MNTRCLAHKHFGSNPTVTACDKLYSWNKMFIRFTLQHQSPSLLTIPDGRETDAYRLQGFIVVSWKLLLPYGWFESHTESFTMSDYQYRIYQWVEHDSCNKRKLMSGCAYAYDHEAASRMIPWPIWVTKLLVKKVSGLGAKSTEQKTEIRDRLADRDISEADQSN